MRGEDAFSLVLPDHVAETVGTEQYANMIAGKRFRGTAERLGERVAAADFSSAIKAQP